MLPSDKPPAINPPASPDDLNVGCDHARDEKFALYGTRLFPYSKELPFKSYFVLDLPSNVLEVSPVSEKSRRWISSSPP